MRFVLKNQSVFLLFLFLILFTLHVICVSSSTVSPTRPTNSKSTPLPPRRPTTIDNVKEKKRVSLVDQDLGSLQIERIRQFTVQKKSYMIPAACRSYENVTNSTPDSILEAMKKVNMNKVSIQLLIRHHSFALSQVSALITLMRNNAELIHPVILTNSIGAIVGKMNNFKIPRKLDVDHVSYLGNLIVHLPGNLVSQLTLPALDLFLDTLHNITNVGADKDETVRNYIYSDMTRLRALCTRVFSLKSQLTTNDIDKVYFLMFCAPPRVCKTISPNDIVSNQAVLFPDPAMFWTPSCAYNTLDEVAKRMILKSNMKGLIERGAGCARELVHSYLSLNSSMFLETFNRIKPILGCVTPRDIASVINGMNCNDAKSALMSYDFTSPLALKIVSKRCILPTVHPFNITCTELGGFGQFLTILPDVFIRGIPQATICQEDCLSQMFGDFKYQNVPQSIKNYVMGKCRPTGPIDTATLQRFGGMVVKLPLESIESLSVSDIATVLNDVKKTLKAEKSPRQRAYVRKMAKKLVEGGSIDDIADDKDFMKQLSLKDLQNVNDVSQLYNSTSLDLPDSQNKFFMKKVLQRTPIENMTAADVRQMNSLVKGLVSSEIARFPPSERMSIATELCSQSNWPMKSAYAINRKLIIGHLQSSLESDPMSVFSPLDVEVLGCECLVHFKPEELSAMSTEACQATCKAIGSCSNFQCLNKRHRQGLLSSCMSCMSLTSTLTISDFADLGRGFMQELSASDISTKISTDDLVNSALMYFQGGCLSVPVRQALKTKIISGLGEPASFDRSTYGSLLELLMIFTDAQLDAADLSIIYDYTSNILEALNPSDDNGKKLKKCCEMWLSESDKEEIKMRTKALYSTLMRARRAAAVSTRQRRSGDPWTCSEIQSVGEAFSGATISEILAIDDSEFTACINHLGTLSGWSTEQITALYNRTTQLQGGVCEISESQIVDMGNIVLGMSLSDISCLDFTTNDLIVALGIPSTWSTEQLNQLASTVIAKRDTPIYDLTADDLTYLRHILCGYNVSVLDYINAEELRACGAQLGTLSGDLCSIEHIHALADKAAESYGYGPASTWDASILSELGIIGAGLSGDKLSSLSISSIEGLSSLAIPYIPSSALAAMSPNQFAAFSASQANSVSPSQRNALSAEQLTAIDSAPYGDDNSNVITTTAAPPSGNGNHDTVDVMNIVLSITMGLLCLCLFLPY